MSFNNENREGHYEDTKIVGKGFDGAMQVTLTVVAGVILIVTGVLISIFMNTRMTYGFTIGVPLVIAGIILPAVFLLFIAGNKSEKPDEP